MDIKTELNRTHPDYVVYVPEGEKNTGNEHFLVFDGPDGSLMVIWTQSTYEGMPDQHIVFARSDDGGKTWTPPKTIACKDETHGMASWAFPLVTHSGRIYAIFSRHIGVNDYATHTTGLMAGIYSDDNGETWSEEGIIPMPKSKWDNADPNIPANWIVWQKPARISDGKYFAGMTRWVSPTVRGEPPIESWISHASVVEFVRFENLDDNPEVKDIHIRFTMSDDEALQYPYPGYPDVSVIQEPTVIALPDDRLFCIMRTAAGYTVYSVSEDGGIKWSQPLPLRFQDGGEILKHPLSPSPMYDVGKGDILFFYHDNDGNFEQWTPIDSNWHRRPIFLVRGQYRPGAEQPVWFSQKEFFMDNDGIPIGYKEGRADLAMYASVTMEGDNPVIWYPERKYFLLGKRIARERITAMKVPER
ncbi:MAG: exo-alpha-sialidase [Opitutaceae bacterium]|nr:exo-alpha-sialidase [Opitutaceae bacterium]